MTEFLLILYTEKQPVVKRLYEELDEHGKEYSELKNEVVAIRNQEKSVNEQIKRAKTQIEKLSQPMVCRSLAMMSYVKR